MLYRTVKTDIWRDPWFIGLTPQSKCLFLYLFTNPSVSACGAMELSLMQIAFETGIPAKKLPAELERLGEKILWIPESNVIVVRNFYKHQRAKSSESYTDAAIKAMAGLPFAAVAWLESVYPELKIGRGVASDRDTPPSPHPPPTLGGKETATATALTTAKATAPAAASKPQNGHAGAAACSYRSVIGDETLGKVAAQFLRVDPSLVPGWFGGMLSKAEATCGPAKRPQLEEAVKVTLSEVERRLAAEKNGGGGQPVVSVKKFTEAVFVRNLSDALGVGR